MDVDPAAWHTSRIRHATRAPNVAFGSDVSHTHDRTSAATLHLLRRREQIAWT